MGASPGSAATTTSDSAVVSHCRQLETVRLGFATKAGPARWERAGWAVLRMPLGWVGALPGGMNSNTSTLAGVSETFDFPVRLRALQLQLDRVHRAYREHCRTLPWSVEPMVGRTYERSGMGGVSQTVDASGLARLQRRAALHGRRGCAGG